MFEKIKYSATTLVDVISAAATQNKLFVDEPQFVSRIKTCKLCEFFISETSRCSKCGCFMETKAKLIAAKCPVSKW